MFGMDNLRLDTKKSRLIRRLRHIEDGQHLALIEQMQNKITPVTWKSAFCDVFGLKSVPLKQKNTWRKERKNVLLEVDVVNDTIIFINMVRRNIGRVL